MHYSDLQASPPAASELEQPELTEAPAEAITAPSAPAAEDALALHEHDLAVWRVRAPARLKIADIEADTNIHARGGLNTSIIDEMCVSVRAFLPMGPVVVFNVDGTNRHYLADGFHRFEAAKTDGDQVIDAEVIQGDRDSAIRYAVFANARHGDRLNLGDLRRGYARYIEQGRFSPLDVEVVAQVLGCSIGYAYDLTEDAREQHDRDQDAEIARRRTAGDTYRSIARGLDMPLATVRDRHVRFVQSAKSERETEPEDTASPEEPEEVVQSPTKPEKERPETTTTLTAAATGSCAEIGPSMSPADDVTEGWGNVLAVARSINRQIQPGEWLRLNPCPPHLRAKVARELRAAETRFAEIRAAFDASKQL